MRDQDFIFATAYVEAVLLLHLVWCGWVLMGWVVTQCRRVLRTLHIASLLYAIVIELVPWPPCPLNRGLKLAQASNPLADRFWYTFSMQ
jgi:hypothetical protein